MSGRVLTTPRSKAECRRLGIDLVALAERVPDGMTLHLIRYHVRWQAGLTRGGGTRYCYGTDLGYLIDYILTDSHA